jgi:hypothetical protein
VLAGGPIRVSGGHSKKTLISYLNNNHSYAFINDFFLRKTTFRKARFDDNLTAFKGDPPCPG